MSVIFSAPTPAEAANTKCRARDALSVPILSFEHEHEFIQPQQQQCRCLCAAQQLWLLNQHLKLSSRQSEKARA